LRVPLYPYQIEGAWFTLRAGWALIGDEMGLGKTIQTIAMMEVLAQHFSLDRVLIISPVSLKYQWQSEIARFSGRAACVIGGGRAKRAQQYAAETM